MADIDSYFHSFSQDVSTFPLPEKLAFPFYYQSNELAERAAEEIQVTLEKNPFGHVFGLDPKQEGVAIGKMFGVLVVQNTDGKLGYLAGFSGKLGNSNDHSGFVPPVFDMLTEQSFYKVGEQELNQITIEIESLPNNAEYQQALLDWEVLIAEENERVQEQKELIQTNRKTRTEQRKLLDETTDSEQIALLNQQSIDEKLVLKNMLRHFQYKRNELLEIITPIRDRIAELKEKRANDSARLQQLLFDNYTFLNAHLEKKSLSKIFENSALGIPAGAGECAAPKLFQFAYLHRLRPIALAEFWWGQSPRSEVRVHKHFYPSCRGKCEPILGHMLTGIEVAENPLLHLKETQVEIPILYEDDDILVVDKPAEYLTVPGKTIFESVYTRIKELRPEAEGPMMVHRLDMSTSGCLVIAKNTFAYTKLQRQFIKRRVQKRYIALLDGLVESDSGTIELPLRVDLDDRPRQLVCYEHGSKAVTHYNVVERSSNQTRIQFYPITGRTHQLRVHAAHSLGLNTPIIGDDLYGTPDKRLCLHAEFISFEHPVTKKTMKFNAPVPF